jgi:hypothetical protein
MGLMPVTALYVKLRNAASQATVRWLMMARSSQLSSRHGEEELAPTLE